MGKHDTKQVTKTVEKSDMPQPEAPDTGPDLHSGSVIHLLQMAVYQMDRNAAASERIATALERLADRFAFSAPAPGIQIAGVAYPECPEGHRMQPTDAQCQTCIRESQARKPLPR